MALGEYRGPRRAHAFRKYAEQVATERMRRHEWQCYMADAWWYNAQGQYNTVRYRDMVEPREDFDAQGVIDSVIERAGLEVIER